MFYSLLYAEQCPELLNQLFIHLGFMDLFPEVEEAFKAAMSLLQLDIHYPLPAFFTLLGFFLVLMVEQLVVYCHSRHHRPYSHPNTPEPSSSPADAVVAEDEVAFEEAHGHSHLPGASVSGSMMQIILLLIALSVHSVFEGLAVGLQHSISEVLSLFTALLLHKLIMAASIGVSLATSQEDQKRFL